MTAPLMVSAAAMWCGSMGKGGWIVQEIDAKILEQLAERAPDLPIIVFKIAVSRLLNWENPPTPAKVREELEDIRDAADSLADALARLSWEAADRIAEAELRHGRSDLRKTLDAELMEFSQMAEVARRLAEKKVSRGNEFKENTAIIAQMAGALQTNGAEANAEKQGQLVWAFQLALDAAGRPSMAKASDTVRKALDGLRKE